MISKRDRSTCGLFVPRMGRLRGLLLAGAILGTAASGCSYPPVGPATYELAEALYNVCNMRDDAQLTKFRELMEARHQAEEVSDEEREVLTDILEIADSGAWDEAERQARQLLLDQNGRDVKFPSHDHGSKRQSH